MSYWLNPSWRRLPDEFLPPGYRIYENRFSNDLVVVFGSEALHTDDFIAAFDRAVALKDVERKIDAHMRQRQAATSELRRRFHWPEIVR